MHTTVVEVNVNTISWVKMLCLSIKNKRNKIAVLVSKGKGVDGEKHTENLFNDGQRINVSEVVKAGSVVGLLQYEHSFLAELNEPFAVPCTCVVIAFGA